MGWSRIAGLRALPRSRAAGDAGPNPFVLSGCLLMAGFAGLVWLAITSSNPNIYVRAVSGWLFFP